MLGTSSLSVVRPTAAEKLRDASLDIRSEVPTDEEGANQVVFARSAAELLAATDMFVYVVSYPIKITPARPPPSCMPEMLVSILPAISAHCVALVPSSNEMLPLCAMPFAAAVSLTAAASCWPQASLR